MEVVTGIILAAVPSVLSRLLTKSKGKFLFDFS